MKAPRVIRLPVTELSFLLPPSSSPNFIVADTLPQKEAKRSEGEEMSAKRAR